MTEQEVLQLAAEVIDNTKGPIRAIKTALQELRDTLRHGPAVSEAQRHAAAIRELHERVDAFRKSVSSNLTEMFDAIGIGALTSSLSIAGVTAALVDLGGQARQLMLLSRQSGMTMDQLRVLGEMGERFGIPAERMYQGVARSTEIIDQLQRHSQLGYDALDAMPGVLIALGRSFDRLSKEGKLDRIFEVATSPQYPLDLRRNLLNLFGFPQDLALYSKDEIRAAYDAAKAWADNNRPDFGALLAFNKATIELKASLRGLYIVMGSEFAPSLRDLVVEIRKMLQNEDNIKALREIFREAADYARSIGIALRDGFVAFKNMVEGTIGWRNLMIAIVGLKLGAFVGSLAIAATELVAIESAPWVVPLLALAGSATLLAFANAGTKAAETKRQDRLRTAPPTTPSKPPAKQEQTQNEIADRIRKAILGRDTKETAEESVSKGVFSGLRDYFMTSMDKLKNLFFGGGVGGGSAEGGAEGGALFRPGIGPRARRGGPLFRPGIGPRARREGGGAFADQTARPGQIRGTLTVIDENGQETKFPFGSGGAGRGPIPFGIFPITPNVMGAWGRAHGALGINYNEIYDPKLGVTRGGIELHAGSSDRLITQGCVAIAGPRWREFKALVLAMIKRTGHAYLYVGPNGATVSPYRPGQKPSTESAAKALRAQQEQRRESPATFDERFPKTGPTFNERFPTLNKEGQIYDEQKRLEEIERNKTKENEDREKDLRRGLLEHAKKVGLFTPVDASASVRVAFSGLPRGSTVRSDSGGFINEMTVDRGAMVG